MTTKTVHSLPWVRLDRTVEEPDCVKDSVPPENAVSFLHMLAQNPLCDTDDATVVKKKLGQLRERRAQHVLAAFPTRSASASGLGSKRKATSALDDDERDGSASDEDYVAGRRRSTRAKVQQGNGTKGSDVDSELPKSRGNAPKVGPNYQVEVPLAVLPEADRTPEMVHVTSEFVYSPSMCKSDEHIAQFLHSVDVELRKRDGFPASPSGKEIALQILAKYEGEIEAAFQEAVRNVGVGKEFPGAGKPWSYEDKCLFVRALGETSKDFSYMSRHILKDRSTSELVFMYYTYHKQQKLQHGSRSGGHIFDTGSEPLTFLPKLGPERVSAAIRCLARTAGDGFPADRRMSDFVHRHRREMTKRNHLRGSRNGTKYYS